VFVLTLTGLVSGGFSDEDERLLSALASARAQPSATRSAGRGLRSPGSDLSIARSTPPGRLAAPASGTDPGSMSDRARVSDRSSPVYYSGVRPTEPSRGTDAGRENAVIVKTSALAFARVKTKASVASTRMPRQCAIANPARSLRRS